MTTAASLQRQAGADQSDESRIARFKQRLYDDFLFFIAQVWIDRKLAKVAPLGWPELDIAEWVAYGPVRRGILAPRGIGKALALDTPIPTPSGWTTMGDLKPGDKVFDENGDQCSVTFATEVMSDRDCYRVCFSDGTSIVADAEHQWQVNDRWASANPKILTTEQMKDRVVLPTKREQNEYRYSIPVAGPLDCDNAILPIEPYMLGVWLGDGSSQCARIHFHADEAEYYKAQADSAGYGFSIKPNRQRGNSCEAVIGGLNTQLRESGLLGNKHIPRAYLRASVAQRLALLQGIVDTDGHIDKVNGRCEITTVSPTLRDGYMELARSLGLKATCVTGRATIDGRDCGEKYRIGFQPTTDMPAARMPRKADRIRPPSDTYQISKTRTITAIEPVDSVPVKCIQVDSPSHLYLAGEAMIPTHNTHIVAAFCLWRAFRDPQRKIIILSKSSREARKTVHLLRKWIDSTTGVWFLRHLCPQRGQRDNANDLDFGPAADNRQASITALGVDGQLEGNRAHTIIPDDCETHENTKTLTAREDLAHRLHECESILYPDVPAADDDLAAVDPSEVIFVGTYHHEESVYLKEQKAGTEFRTWPAEYPREGEKHLNLAPRVAARVYQGKAHPGDPVFAHRFSRENLDRKKRRGRIYWGMQHQLLCNLGDTNRYPLRLSDLIVMDVPPPPGPAPTHVVYGQSTNTGSTAIEGIPCLGWGSERLYAPAMIADPREWLPYTTTKAFLDPAGRGTDRTGLAVGSYLASRIFVHAVHGLPGGASDEKLDHIVKLLRSLHATTIGLEGNIDAFGTYHLMLQASIRRHILRPGEHPDYPNGWGCRIQTVHAHGQKELRIINSIEPVSSSHRLIVDKSVVIPDPVDPNDDAENLDLNDFQFQLSRLTREPKCLEEDGKIDALAGLCRLFDTSLAADPTRSGDRLQSARAEKERLEHLALVKQAHAGDSTTRVIKHRWG